MFHVSLFQCFSIEIYNRSAKLPLRPLRFCKGLPLQRLAFFNQKKRNPKQIHREKKKFSAQTKPNQPQFTSAIKVTELFSIGQELLSVVGQGRGAESAACSGTLAGLILPATGKMLEAGFIRKITEEKKKKKRHLTAPILKKNTR